MKLFSILVHMLTETSRHAGRADILREQLDESAGATTQCATPHRDATFWEAQCAKIERAAKAAATTPDHAGSYDSML
ncbi:mycothiol transferase [Streptomyces sp. NBC_01255]|uniref:mycothiol transferase n=1 Tax=Streptomyces sp. NBC_01255 TaxID=2903798 RepID=UPI003FCDDED3